MGYRYRKPYQKYDGKFTSDGCFKIILLWIVCILGIAIPPLGVIFIIIFIFTANWKQDF